MSSESTRKCESWDYDQSFWRRTIIQEWDLVCERNELRKLTQQATFFGLLVGVFASGLISDRFGRMPAMMSLLSCCVLFGLLSAFATSYTVFLIGIWACGFSSIGFGTVMYCWMMEIIGGLKCADS